MKIGAMCALEPESRLGEALGVQGVHHADDVAAVDLIHQKICRGLERRVARSG